jgi:putative tryptophan/tyrosine transport system substrate-binding protein
VLTRATRLHSTPEPPYRPRMDRRRFLLTSLAGVLAAPLAGGAQQTGKVYQVGLLSNGGNPATWRVQYAAFVDAMRELNYVEGRNLIIKPAFADGRAERVPALAAELIRAKVDVIVTSATLETLAAKRATSSIPIVMWLVPDPVAEGIVASLSRPGGNITGLTSLVPGLSQKYVELLREVVPSASQFVVVVSPTNPRPDVRQDLEAAGRALGVTVAIAHVSGPEDFDSVLARAKKDGAVGIIATSDAVTFLHRRKLAQAALKHRLPGLYWSRVFVEEGGLMTYSANIDDLRRRAATYVDKVLRGASPGGLPVEQPTKFELVINLKTARALGLTIPPSLLARADQVVE